MKLRDDFPQADEGTDIDGDSACIGSETAGLGASVENGVPAVLVVLGGSSFASVEPQFMRDNKPPAAPIEPNSCLFDSPQGTVRGEFCTPASTP